MKLRYPATRVEDVVDEIHGVKVADPYRWLEDKDNPNFRPWIESQSALASAIIEGFQGREKVEKRLKELLSHGDADANWIEVRETASGPRIFILLRNPGAPQRTLFYQDGLLGDRIPLVSPGSMESESFLSIDWFYPSPDGKLVAYGLSEGGTLNSILHIVDVESGENLSGTIPKTKFCTLVWLSDSSGFYYSRYPLPGSVPPEQEHYNSHVYFHEIGTDYMNDKKVFGEGRDPTEFPNLAISPNGEFLSVMPYRFTESDVYIAKIDSNNHSRLEFHTVIEGRPSVNVAVLDNSTLYLYTQEDAPNGRILSYDLADFLAGRKDGRVLIDESDGVLSHKNRLFGISNDLLVVVEEFNASSRMKIYNKATGELIENVGFDTPIAIEHLATSNGSPGIYYTADSFFSPTMISYYEVGKGPGDIYKPELGLDKDEFKAKQVWFDSKDGTRVPMFLIAKRNTELGPKTPVTLAGYGGFAISETPSFIPATIVWAEAGGVVARASLRGGGEFGQKWHRAGNRENKQNVFDDFIAAAEWLIDNEIGSRDTLAIAGGSNGGLLVGAALVQRPDLFRCVYCAVPLLDMIRYTNFHYAKAYAHEYGDPEKGDEFRYLLAYSPYHNVRKDIEYPATLFYTAEGDDRVDIMHAMKMTAMVQAATTGSIEENPIILWVEQKSGHGIGLPVDVLVKRDARHTLFRAHFTGLRFK